MTKETNLQIESVGTNGHEYWVIVNGEKMTITRAQYFMIMLLSEDADVYMEDVADFQNQMATGIPAF